MWQLRSLNAHKGEHGGKNMASRIDERRMRDDRKEHEWCFDRRMLLLVQQEIRKRTF